MQNQHQANNHRKATGKRKWGPFIGLFLMGAVGHFVVYLILYTTCFDEGIQTLNQRERDDAFYFYTYLLVVAIQGWQIASLYRKGYRPAAVGLALTFAVGLYYLAISTVPYFRRFDYDTFDKAAWSNESTRTMGAAKTLLRDSSFTGRSKASVFATLSEGKEDHGGLFDETFSWKCGDDSWFQIMFDNGVAVQTVMVVRRRVPEIPSDVPDKSADLK